MRTRRPARDLMLATLLGGVLTVTACSSAPEGSRQPESAQTTAPFVGGENNPTAGDEAAVRNLLDQINKTWAQGDATAFASFHTPDADLIDFRGIHAVGRQEIIELLQPAFDGPLKNTRVEARIVDLRFLSSDVAIFHSVGQIVPVGDNSIQTFVATKDAEGWLIAAFQNTRIQGPT